ncbi:hypothetical protein ABTX79_34755, partial [Streptomyces sp. NPDC096153]
MTQPLTIPDTASARDDVSAEAAATMAGVDRASATGTSAGRDVASVGGPEVTSAAGIAPASVAGTAAGTVPGSPEAWEGSSAGGRSGGCGGAS